VEKVIENLEAVVGRDNVLAQPDELIVYECDGLPQHKHRPRAVVFPSSTEETAEVMRLLAQLGVPFTPRGAGTGLSGGALALNHGVVIELARMRKVLKIDKANRIAVVQTGVVNSHVSRVVASLGLHYVPDPSSQPTCTIGGNIAENAGGIHCLKYGTTTDHVLGLRVVLGGGEIVELGSETEQPGFDLLGVFVGSEGTFGIATEATLRLVPIPPTVRTLLAEFEQVDDASHAVSAIIAAGVMPAALEMMDHEIIRAVEASVFAAGLSLDVGAALLIELDGIEAGIDDEAERVKSICLDYGARSCRSAQDEAERKRLWAARKSAFGAVSRISPDSMIQDAVVPRSRLPEVLADAYRISSKYELRLANVFHAGDGNLHPLICFDSSDPDQVHRVKEAGRELMETCVRAGGSITGEHGVGFDKRELLPLIFSEDDMDAMLRVRAAFDPTGLCNPGKIIPMLRGCGEARAVASSETGADGDSQRGSAGVLVAAESTQPSTTDSGLSDNTRSLFAPLSGDSTRPPYRNWQRSSANEEGAKRAAAIVGDANVLPSPVSDYPVAILVTPGSVAEVCEIMRLAAEERYAVVPAGAGTWLDAGNSLERADLILSTQRLNRIIEHEPADLVAITEAGVTFRDFNHQLFLKGQWLPLDPPDDGGATIGGVVATGLSGPQQLGYGTPRRHVIGMKVVRADGSLIKVGGRVVKNVAGYDLCKLFTGSYGTLGVIVEVNFKLRPVPLETRTILAVGDRENLLSGARCLIDAHLFPVAAELLSPQLAQETALGEGKDHLLLIRFAGSSNAVTAQANDAGQLLQDKVGSRPGAHVSDDSTLWQSLAALPLRFSKEVVWRASVRAADTAQFLTALDKAYPGNSSSLMWQAAPGEGRTRVIDGSTQEDELISHVNSLRAHATEVGGSLTIENASAEFRKSVNAWGSLGQSAALMHRVKQQLDPNRIFSPGRFDAII
jgi:glycolate oxidase subunit GlcD